MSILFVFIIRRFASPAPTDPNAKANSPTNIVAGIPSMTSNISPSFNDRTNRNIEKETNDAE